MEIDPHRLSTITVIIIAGQSHQWMLKVVGEIKVGNRIFAEVSKNPPTRHILSTKKEIVT